MNFQGLQKQTVKNQIVQEMEYVNKKFANAIKTSIPQTAPYQIRPYSNIIQILKKPYTINCQYC